ncbi:MAG: DnaJ domain-containing protein [Candidatus Yanofskybacteria bacterium]|nr:DnaJ domain-containing protein [Candidatus Yanofskybacteria bacterium]
MQADPYTILGISRNASQEEIKKAYRKLAHQHHPDKTGGDDKKFKEINEAYQILSDPKKRSSFDNFGQAYNDGGFQGNPFGQGGFDFGDIFRGRGGGLEDIFDMFSGAFNGQQAYQEQARGEDIYLEIRVTKKDLNTKKIFEYQVYKQCDECQATGLAKGARVITCSTCNGNGQVRETSRTPFGAFTRVMVCQVCKGKGRLPEKECHVCKGNGRTAGKKRIELHIPKDLADGYSVVVPQGGNAGPLGKPTGDLVINFKLK